jgi:hypothetical protein
VHAQIVMEAIHSIVMEAMHAQIVMEDIQNLVLEAQQLKDFQRWMGDENNEFTYQIS